MRAWWLNLDADLELGRPGAPPSARVMATSQTMRALMAPLWIDGDVVLDGDMVLEGDQRADGCVGRAWCPTPRALAALARAGARLPDAPSFDVLRRVNHRAFCAELGQTLEGARWVATMDALADALSEPRARGWLLKRPYSFAGTGQRRVSRLEGGELDWARASLARDGLQVEPIVDIALELSIHGWLDKNGQLVVGEPCVQQVGAGGVWQRSTRAGDAISARERSALTAEVERVARALHEAGYHGPFGVDAYRYQDGRQTALNRRSEINARYTMSWALGMGDRRPDLAHDGEHASIVVS
jgi:hypothetical protein